MSPLTLKQFRRFRSIKRGYYSFILFFLLVLLSAIAELWINSRALIVYHEGRLHFPTYSTMIPGHVFGFSYDYETNYRDLKQKFAAAGQGDWVLMPLVPYNEYENDLTPRFGTDGERMYPPFAPSTETEHYLGTDRTGRDIVARLVYGFRTAILFSLLLLIFNYVIGVFVGCFMGYAGGAFDLLFQRLIEILSNIPFLYLIIIVASIKPPTFSVLLGLMVVFGWMGITWYMRTATYKEKAREYVLAARTLGASWQRVILRHIIPNTVGLIVTFIPFSILSGIVALTSLDYLGYGLPPPTPSWGELLSQGTSNLEAYWIIWSVITFMVTVLVMVTFVGEAVREAFDPKRFTTYE
jgi:microcin C transport system permease protein